MRLAAAGEEEDAWLCGAEALQVVLEGLALAPNRTSRWRRWRVSRLAPLLPMRPR